MGEAVGEFVDLAPGAVALGDGLGEFEGGSGASGLHGSVLFKNNFNLRSWGFY